MYKSKHSGQQLEFVDFYLPFGGKLKTNNRWVILRSLIPWDEIEEEYAKNFSKRGPRALSSQIALGSLIIKERLDLTDEETAAQISENPYLQYFIGFEEFSDDLPFDSSSLTHFRKRFDLDTINRFNEIICLKKDDDVEKSNDEDDTKDPPKPIENQGQLLMDATCIPADITYPTDMKLLNKCREKSEKIIDLLHKKENDKKKVRTYRQKARKNFLGFIRKKRHSNKVRRKAISKQLSYLKRNLAHIEELKKGCGLGILGKGLHRDLIVINEIYRQQKDLFLRKSTQVDDRIVSLSQPHIRPIKRGKLKAATEFGAKISISLVDGLSYLDRLSWDAYNETEDLIPQVESYKQRHGFYPESVHADQIYRSVKNRNYCKEKGIRLSGKPLGRPTKDSEILALQKDQFRLDEISRIPVEGKFGQVKRRFGLSRLMCKLAKTSETVIALVFMISNLEKKLVRAFIFVFISVAKRLFERSFKQWNCKKYGEMIMRFRSV